MSVRDGVPLRAVPMRRRCVRLQKALDRRTILTVDARALTKVLTDERAGFVRLARKRVASDADADDIVQHSLMRAAERAGSLEDEARARAWFYRILRNAIADHHRSRPQDPLRHQDGADVTELASEDPAPTRTPCTCSVRLLDALRPAYAEVVRRIDVNGEDPVAVARALGISPGNLHVRLHRARRILRDEIRHYCHVESLRPCLDCACDRHHRCGLPAHSAGRPDRSP